MRLENILTINTIFEEGDLNKYHINVYARLGKDGNGAIFYRYNERFVCRKSTRNPKEWVVVYKYEAEDVNSRGKEDGSLRNGESSGDTKQGRVSKIHSNEPELVDNHPDTPIDLDAIRRSGI